MPPLDAALIAAVSAALAPFHGNAHVTLTPPSFPWQLAAQGARSVFCVEVDNPSVAGLVNEVILRVPIRT